MKIKIKHIMSTGLMLLMSFMAQAYTIPTAYEYWFDNNRNSLVSGNAATDGFDLAIDVSGLSAGFHTLYYRMIDSDGQSGMPGFKRFFNPGDISWGTSNSSRTPVAYEYWFDNDRGSLVSGQCTADGFDVSVDVSGLSSGYHTLYYRMIDSNGKSGMPGYKRFFSPGSITWGSDNSSCTPVAYRSFINNKVIDTHPIDDGSVDFEFQISIDDDVEVSDIYGWDFNMPGSTVMATFRGYFTYGFQLLSSTNEWGAPLIYKAQKTQEVEKTPETIDPVTTINVPKLGEKDFLAYKIETKYPIYVKANQSCETIVFNANNSSFNSFWQSWRSYDDVKKGDEISGSEYGYVIVIYNTPINSEYPDSNIEISFGFSNGKTPTPRLQYDYDTKILTMECAEPEAVIYYTIDGSLPTHESTVYMEPIQVDHNMTVHAMAWTEDYGDSSDAMLTIDPFTVPGPQLERQGIGYVFTNSLEGVTTYYTTDGTYPTTSNTRKVFDGTPFEIDEACTIYAYSTKENFHDSGVNSFDVTPKCANPEVASYDGHYVTLTCPDPMATIYYRDPRSWEETIYDDGEKIELIYYSNNLDFVARREESGFEESDWQYFCPEYFSKMNDDGTQMELYLRTEGVASKAFEWLNELDFEKLKVTANDFNWNRFDLNDSDFNYIKSLPALKYLDFSDTGITKIVDNAFSNSTLMSLTLPSTVTSFGETPFSGCSNLLSLEIKADVALPSELFSGAELNPNMMLFVPKVANADAVASQVTNIIGDDEAPVVVLTDGYPYYSSKQYFVSKISYTRNFSKTTPIGGCAGWEAISLPFYVETVSHSKGTLMPFGWWGGDLNYWLYNFNENVWQQDGGLNSNESCIIAMPNNENYYDEYCVNGEVTFSSTNQYVYATSEIESTYFSYRNSRFKPNYSNIEASDNIMVLNDETYLADGQSFEPGSVFVAGQRAPRPFEAYMLNTSGTRYLRVSAGSGMDEIVSSMGFRVWTEGGEICISSGIPSRVRIFDTVGRLITVADVKNDETTRIGGLAPGIYIVGDSKIIVK